MERDLMGFVSSLQGGDGLRVEETLGNGYVRLRIAEAERRQAKHDIRCVEDAVIEMLRNARDAGASRIFVGTARVDDLRTILMVDDGCGIPAEMHERVFDARVTSKLDSLHMDRWGVHGRGMALFSIAQNATEAVVVDSAPGMGTSMRATFDVKSIGERADQSTWPKVSGSAGAYEVRGPRNIVRACVDFALEERGRCNVYFGSMSEAIAAMRGRVRPPASVAASTWEEAQAAVRLVERPALAADARELRQVACSLGADMSERTAHRIIRKQVACNRHVLTYVLDAGGAAAQGPGTDETRALSLSQADRDEFALRMSDAFAELAERYYVVPAGEPRISLGKGVVRITFEYTDDN